jgi:hypothetical protein
MLSSWLASAIMVARLPVASAALTWLITCADRD